MGIHQILVGASAGDAITELAISHRNRLREHLDSEIYACWVDNTTQGIHDLDSYERHGRTGRDLLVFHASIGEPRVNEFLMNRPEPLMLVYHNIAPAAPFAGFDPKFASLLAAGRAELVELRDRVVVSVADSEYNAAELRSLGFADVRVVAPVTGVDALLGVEPRPALRRHLHETTQGPAVLFVGQILPHKAIERLVLAFHVLVTYLAPDAHLFLVGPKRTEAYAATLLRLIGSLCLAQVAMPGKVPAEDLAAYYERADLFVTLSRHEGFCIPLVEAMAFDVPIVASDAAAIPETLGGAGLLVPAKASPTFVAETMASVLTDGPLRRHLVERGRRRLADFPSKQLEDHFLEVALGAYRP